MNEIKEIDGKLLYKVEICSMYDVRLDLSYEVLTPENIGRLIERVKKNLLDYYEEYKDQYEKLYIEEYKDSDGYLEHFLHGYRQPTEKELEDYKKARNLSKELRKEQYKKLKKEFENGN